MCEANPYSDIINLPHHVSQKRPQMSAHDRAAQFSPFAALTGYEAEIRETERLTEEKRELDEYSAARNDACLQMLIDNAEDMPDVTVTYFIKDEKKDGGEYVTVNGCFRRIDESSASFVFTDGKTIPLNDIYSFDSKIFTFYKI